MQPFDGPPLALAGIPDSLGHPAMMRANLSEK
jgi:hypothetical protein